MKASKSPAAGRGRIVRVKLKRPFTFNSDLKTVAIIEIDHINHGINKSTATLNKNKRTHFTLSDIEQFLWMLNGEQIAADEYKGKISKFSLKIDCPVRGRFFGKQFLMIFDTDYSKPNEIYTITLIPRWRS